MRVRGQNNDTRVLYGRLSICAGIVRICSTCLPPTAAGKDQLPPMQTSIDRGIYLHDGSLIYDHFVATSYSAVAGKLRSRDLPLCASSQ